MNCGFLTQPCPLWEMPISESRRRIRETFTDEEVSEGSTFRRTSSTFTSIFTSFLNSNLPSSKIFSHALFNAESKRGFLGVHQCEFLEGPASDQRHRNSLSNPPSPINIEELFRKCRYWQSCPYRSGSPRTGPGSTGRRQPPAWKHTRWGRWSWV